MMANALRAIVGGRNFQLYADVTGNLCNRSVYLLELSFTSFPCKKNVLCSFIIPKATESHKVYTRTYADCAQLPIFCARSGSVVPTVRCAPRFESC
jgi:hypothetical protein